MDRGVLLTVSFMQSMATGGHARLVAIADVPGNQSIAELIELYLDAMVIDVNRDPDEWLASLNTVTQYTDTSLWWLHYFLAPIPGWRWPRPISSSALVCRAGSGTLQSIFFKVFWPAQERNSGYVSRVIKIRSPNNGSVLFSRPKI